jgi:hypothetical protein
MKKLSCNLLLTCDQTILSKDNKISLIGIFDQIFLPEIPGNHPKMSLVGIVSGEPFSDHKLTINFKDPQDKLVYPDQEISVNLGSTGKSNLVAEFVNLPIQNLGLYTFSLYSGKTLLASTSLNISKVPQPPAKSKVIN